MWGVQEMLEMHANLIRVMDPREVMVTQAKSLLKANKLNRDLMKKVNTNPIRNVWGCLF
jgi:hypothetical protein